jgi:hypothetical protein
VIARRVLALAEVAGVPTMSSWPTRCDSDIRASVASAGSEGVAAGGSGAAVAEVGDDGAVVVEAPVEAALGEDATGADDDVRSAARSAARPPAQPATVLAAATTATRAPRAGRRKDHMPSTVRRSVAEPAGLARVAR